MGDRGSIHCAKRDRDQQRNETAANWQSLWTKDGAEDGNLVGMFSFMTFFTVRGF